MKYLFSLFPLAALLACAGCARSITYVYYPGVAHSETFPRDAEVQCAKYGMNSIFRGNGFSDFGRTTQIYECIPKGVGELPTPLMTSSRDAAATEAVVEQTNDNPATPFARARVGKPAAGGVSDNPPERADSTPSPAGG
jgi:hypothetical protein